MTKDLIDLKKYKAIRQKATSFFTELKVIRLLDISIEQEVSKFMRSVVEYDLIEEKMRIMNGLPNNLFKIGA